MLALVLLTLLHGTVRIGPTTPVCHVGTRCDKPAAHVVLTFVRRGTIVRAVTDARGRYTVRLRAGTWTVRTRIGTGIAPRTFVVPRAASATRSFAIDTGIR